MALHRAINGLSYHFHFLYFIHFLPKDLTSYILIKVSHGHSRSFFFNPTVSSFKYLVVVTSCNYISTSICIPNCHLKCLQRSWLWSCIKLKSYCIYRWLLAVWSAITHLKATELSNLLKYIAKLSKLSRVDVTDSCYCCCSVTKTCLTLRNLTGCSIPGFSVPHHPWSLPKIMSSELVVPSSHLILCCPFLFLPLIFPRLGSFPMSHLFTSGGQIIEASDSASDLPMNIQGWFPSRLTGLTLLQSKTVV